MSRSKPPSSSRRYAARRVPCCLLQLPVAPPAALPRTFQMKAAAPLHRFPLNQRFHCCALRHYFPFRTAGPAPTHRPLLLWTLL